jgi:flagellar motor protein MotB
MSEHQKKKSHGPSGGGHEEAHEGAPEWLISFADNTALIMGFFVILLALNMGPKGGGSGSESGAAGGSPSDYEMDWAVAVRNAFHNPVNINSTNPRDLMLAQHLKKKKSLEEMKKKVAAELGKSNEEGIQGEHPSVTNIREGKAITFGGQVSFESGKAVLLDQAKKQIDIFIPDLAGLNHKICIRGHAAKVPEEVYRPFISLDDLSYARAKAVKDYLIEKGIRQERITLEACGVNEPIRAQAYDEESRAINRRVSIIIMENLVEEYKGQPAANKGDITDG